MASLIDESSFLRLVGDPSDVSFDPRLFDTRLAALNICLACLSSPKML